jgi:hypothetical protein
MDEPMPEFQPGDVVEISISIEHTANLAAVKAAFEHEEYPRDVRFDERLLEVELSAGEERGTSVATFTFTIPPEDRWRGEYKMTQLRVSTVVGSFLGKRPDIQVPDILVEDAPVIRFKIVPERSEHLRANGFEMRLI